MDKMEIKEKIENFVEEITKKNDFQILDILWIFSYSIPSMSGYHDNIEAFKKWLGRVCVRNLQKKYNLKRAEIKEKMRVFIDFLKNMPDFLSEKTFEDDNKLLREILFNKTSEILKQNINDKLSKLSELDRKILSFLINYLPIESKSTKGYPFPPLVGSQFHIRVNEERSEIIYFNINLKEWTYIFNQLFDEELKEEKFKTKSYRRRRRLILFPQQQYEEYSFWQFGDELVKMGVGYWTFTISSSGNTDIFFTIPNFIYEQIKNYKIQLPIIDNFVEKIGEIKKEKKTKKVEEEWGIEDFEDKEVVSEADIEAPIVSNPEILEEGLELIGNQYSTPVGYIDILCRDKNGNIVVIELKKGGGSYKVVGQIQKYMAWINENLAKDKQVRGIIVAKKYDEELGYAVKGSKFPIEIKVFGEEPPTEENIKYCDRCGKPNKKSAKYCIKCGQEFWM